MKKYSFVLTLVFVFVQLLSFCQKTPATRPKTASKPVATHQPVPVKKQPPIKDTLAFYVQTTINELNAYIRDTSQPAESISGNYFGKDGYCKPSIIQIPQSLTNELCEMRKDRLKGTQHWRWESILLRSDKDQMPALTFISLRLKLDSIIRAMPVIKESNEKNSIIKIEAFENVSDLQYRYLHKTDDVGIWVEFVKPLRQTEQQCIDSLLKIYRPGWIGSETAWNAAWKFTTALSDEGFSTEKSKMIFADELKVVADKNIQAAFQMLMGTYLPDPLSLMVKLTDPQKSEIHRMSKELVKAYNAKWEPVVPPPANKASSNSSNGTQQPYQQPQPQGKRVKCSVCNGVGQYEKLIRSHTYDGIYSQVTTNTTKWVVCDVCNGTGWVTKYKK